MRRLSSRSATLLSILALAAMLAGPAMALHAERGAPATASLLERARAATDRYHDVDAALAAGYEEAGPCLALPDGGGLGQHFVRTELFDADLRAEEPEVLLYAPLADGRLRLVGVKYVSTDPDATLFGQSLLPGPSGPSLYVWLWQPNPDGLFAELNPLVWCR
jgi:hypothetical protein